MDFMPGALLDNASAGRAAELIPDGLVAADGEGRIIFLNHFLSPNPILSKVERMISPYTIHIGFKSDLDLPAFLAQADLQPQSIEKVNIPRLWSLVTTVK